MFENDHLSRLKQFDGDVHDPSGVTGLVYDLFVGLTDWTSGEKTAVDDSRML